MVRYRELHNQINSAIPYIVLFDVIGAQDIDGSFLTWDSVKTCSSHFLYTIDTDKIFLATNSSGLFEVTFDVSLTGMAVNHFEIYKNGVLIPESCMYVSPMVGGQSPYVESGSLHYVVFLQRNDYIQIKGSTAGGNGATIGNTCRLFIKGLPMLGFNNDSGGRVMYRGGVMR